MINLHMSIRWKEGIQGLSATFNKGIDVLSCMRNAQNGKDVEVLK